MPSWDIRHLWEQLLFLSFFNPPPPTHTLTNSIETQWQVPRKSHEGDTSTSWSGRRQKWEHMSDLPASASGWGSQLFGCGIIWVKMFSPVLPSEPCSKGTRSGPFLFSCPSVTDLVSITNTLKSQFNYHYQLKDKIKNKMLKMICLEFEKRAFECVPPLLDK